MKTIQFVLVLLGSIAILAGGCTKSVENSKYNYASGHLTSMLSADVQKSYDASLRAIEQLQLEPSSKTKDLLGAKIVTKTYDGKKVTILLKRVTDTSTDITIAVGAIGDKETSATIYSKILENIKQ